MAGAASAIPPYAVITRFLSSANVLIDGINTAVARPIATAFFEGKIIQVSRLINLVCGILAALALLLAVTALAYADIILRELGLGVTDTQHLMWIALSGQVANMIAGNAGFALAITGASETIYRITVRTSLPATILMIPAACFGAAGVMIVMSGYLLVQNIMLFGALREHIRIARTQEPRKRNASLIR